MNNITIKLTISDKQIDDILCTAFEGGINYWCYSVTPVIKIKEEHKDLWSHQLLSKGYEMVLEEHELDESYFLTKEKFVNGVKLYISENNNTNFNNVFDNHDAEVADQIIQYALFGEIIYS